MVCKATQSSLASPSFVNNNLVKYQEFQCNITNHAVQLSRLKKFFFDFQHIFSQQIINNLVEVIKIFLQNQQTFITSFNKIVYLPTYQIYY